MGLDFPSSRRSDLARGILPTLIRTRCGSKRRLNIWSVGCCTGEEPYSIAILLSRLLPAGQEWHITILATDINRHFLRRALQGLSGKRSCRQTPSWLQQHYFTRTAAGQFAIRPHVQQMVRFASHHIATDPVLPLVHDLGGMGVIMYCHVQMYLAPSARQHAMRCLSQALSLLQQRQMEDRLRECEGMTAEGLADIIRSFIRSESS